MLLDSDGTLHWEGWEAYPGWSGDIMPQVNQQVAKSHFGFDNYWLTDKMARNLNYLFFSLGDLEVMLAAPLMFGHGSPNCVTTMRVFNRTEGPVTDNEDKRQWESKTCPTMFQSADSSPFQSQGLIINDPNLRV